MRRLALLLAAVLLAPGAAVGQRTSGKSYSSGGGKSYSSGSKSSSSGSKSSSSGKSYSPSSKSSSSSSSKGSTFSPSRPASSSSSKPPASSPPRPSRPSSSSYDAGAGSAAKRAESKSIFERRSSPNVPGVPSSPRNTPAGKSYSERNVPPAPTFTPGPAPRTTYNQAGQPRPLDPTDRRVDQLRREMNEDRWYSRTQRTRTVFVNVGPPAGYSVVHYSDPYSNLFWWWLLSRSLDDRAYWAYHHRHSMDPLRYRDLLERDRALEARIRELEAKNVPRNPAAAPPGVDPDLMYSDEFVESAVNPTLPPDYDEPAPRSSGGGWLFQSCCIVFLIAGIILFAIWFIFIKRWGGT